jgi:hypothetical protein
MAKILADTSGLMNLCKKPVETFYSGSPAPSALSPFVLMSTWHEGRKNKCDRLTGPRRHVDRDDFGVCPVLNSPGLEKNFLISARLYWEEF